MKEAPGSSETSVHTRATRRNVPEDNILHSHRRENLKSYNVKKVLNFYAEDLHWPDNAEYEYTNFRELFILRM
jgi:hypothetical protein